MINLSSRATDYSRVIAVRRRRATRATTRGAAAEFRGRWRRVPGERGADRGRYRHARRWGRGEDRRDRRARRSASRRALWRTSPLPGSATRPWAGRHSSSCRGRRSAVRRPPRDFIAAIGLDSIIGDCDCRPSESCRRARRIASWPSSRNSGSSRLASLKIEFSTTNAPNRQLGLVGRALQVHKPSLDARRHLLEANLDRRRSRIDRAEAAPEACSKLPSVHTRVLESSRSSARPAATATASPPDRKKQSRTRLARAAGESLDDL